jgi:hypothetical protein
MIDVLELVSKVLIAIIAVAAGGAVLCSVGYLLFCLISGKRL